MWRHVDKLSSTMKIELTCSCKTSGAIYHTTRCKVPKENSNVNGDRSEIINFRIFIYSLFNDAANTLGNNGSHNGFIIEW
jgi:hypothetical protein